MYEQSTTVQNPTGIHARPAADFIAASKKYASRIKIGRQGEEKFVDAKSILMVLSLGLKQGTRVTIKAQGDDEQAAVEGLIGLIDGGFGE